MPIASYLPKQVDLSDRKMQLYNRLRALQEVQDVAEEQLCLMLPPY